MSSVAASPGLAEAENFLVRKTEESFEIGLQLGAWLRERGETLAWKPLDLGVQGRLPHTQACHLGLVKAGGVERTVMATRQVLELGPLGDRTPDALRQWILGWFIPTSHWINQDGTPGGLTIEKFLYRTPAGQYGRFAESEREGGGDFSELGGKYEWVLLTIAPNDLAMDLGLFRLRIYVVPYLAIHPGLVHVVENPFPGYKLEVTVGYTCVDVAPLALRPPWVGYGPGRFVSATKVYQFLVADNNQIRVRMYFAAAPRSQKFLDFGKKWPDPVYGSVDLLYRLSFGLFPRDRFHDLLDAQIAKSHCQLYQALLDGAERNWSAWRSGPSQNQTGVGA